MLAKVERHTGLDALELGEKYGADEDVDGHDECQKDFVHAALLRYLLLSRMRSHLQAALLPYEIGLRLVYPYQYSRTVA